MLGYTSKDVIKEFGLPEVSTARQPPLRDVDRVSWQQDPTAEPHSNRASVLFGESGPPRSDLTFFFSPRTVRRRVV